MNKLDAAALPGEYEEGKAWIDGASYEELLYRWRFGPIGSPWFVGKLGEYYKKVLAAKRNAESNPGCVSKRIGWTPPAK